MKTVKRILSLFVLILATALPLQTAAVERHEAPEGFLCGINNNTFQNYGLLLTTDVENESDETNWTTHEKQPGNIKHGATSADMWQGKTRDDLKQQQLTDLDEIADDGYGLVRVSLEWNMVQPRCPSENDDGFVQTGIDHFRNVCDRVKGRGMKLMFTLHHFTHPQWFEDLGGFANWEAVVHYFIPYCQRMFAEFHQDVDFWCTLNEPNVFAMMGYMIANFKEGDEAGVEEEKKVPVFPPGRSNATEAGEVLCNLFRAHCAVYDALKAMEGGDASVIGINHQYLRFEPYHTVNLIARGIEWLTASTFNAILLDPFMSFFRDGVFSYKKKLNFLNKTVMTNVTFEPDYTPGEKLDCLFVNYYSRTVVRAHATTTVRDIIQPTCYEGETMTDMPYAIYPEGIYEALMACSVLGKPMMITETGMPDRSESPEGRRRWVDEYYQQIFRAHHELQIRTHGEVGILGSCWWCDYENFEWADGYTQNYGMRRRNEDGTTRLAPGAISMIELMAAHKQAAA